MGWVLGFSPLLSLQSILVLLVMFIFRIQLGAAFISAFFFQFIAYAFDPVCDALGRWVLEQPNLRPYFEWAYATPFIPFTRFNNSIVMGSGIFALLGAPLIAVVAYYLVKKYRISVMERFKNTKLFKAFKMTAFYRWYAKYDELFN